MPNFVIRRTAALLFAVFCCSCGGASQATGGRVDAAFVGGGREAGQAGDGAGDEEGSSGARDAGPPEAGVPDAGDADGGTDAWMASGPDGCDDAFPTTGPPPPNVGCYVGTSCGWQKVPCNCELSVVSPSALATNVVFALTVTPSNAAPALTGLPDIEVAFDDPGASWFAAWSAQSGAGSTFTVTMASGKTTVRLATSNLVLASVSLAASASREAWGLIAGALSGTKLSMKATVSDARGGTLAAPEGTCEQIMHP
jgi:hypothetical protein